MVYTVVPLPWQRVTTLPVGTGVEGFEASGVTVMVLADPAVRLPLQLTAWTVTVAVPLYVLLQLMVADVPVAVG